MKGVDSALDVCMHVGPSAKPPMPAQRFGPWITSSIPVEMSTNRLEDGHTSDEKRVGIDDGV